MLGSRVYAENANMAAYAIEGAMGAYMGYTLLDDDTVRLLAMESGALVPEVPYPKTQRAKDVRWNRQRFRSAITQGILQGESVPKVAERVQSVIGMDSRAATRAARTALTGAQNAGRVNAYERMADEGCRLKQEWMATYDTRTRDSHRKLDGERVEIGGSWQAERGELRFPGDPQAHPAETWNCRCRVRAVVDGIDQDSADRFSRLPAGTTYEQWKAGKAKSAHDSTGRTMGEFMQTPLVRKQLAKRGLTEAQGRKLLSEQLKADGATGHQFRTMTKQQQRKAWNGALDRKKPTEMEIARKDIKPVNEQLYGSLRAYVERRGGRVYRGDDFVTRYLDKR